LYQIIVCSRMSNFGSEKPQSNWKNNNNNKQQQPKTPTYMEQ